MDVAGEDLGEEELLLLVAPETHDRGGNAVDREHGHGCARSHRLVEEHELFDRGATLAAVLLRPTDTGPPVGAHLLPDGPHRPTDTARLAEFGDRVGVEQLLVVLTEPRSQLFLLRGVADLHCGSAF